MKKLIEKTTNYYVDDQGVVYNQNKVLRQDKSRSYNRVAVRNSDGKVVKWSVHRLVATHFIPNLENKPYVNHIDGDKRNNVASNLEWVTNSENMIHARNLDLQPNCDDTYNSVFTNQQIEELCKKLEEGYRNCDICKILNLPKHIVSKVRNGIVWNNISKNYNIKTTRQKRVSVDTVLWVADKLSLGCEVKEILELATNPEVNKALIYSIKSRISYADLTKEFVF